jgi:peptide/nickel transport system substrate-binding protein
MNTRPMAFLSGVVFLAFILVTGYQPVAAAPPTGEVKVMAQTFGNEVPIHFLESSHSKNWMMLLYDHLVACTPEGKLSPDLGLAHKWEMSPDGLTWTFYLRKGVKFHDGVEVTAKDVKFSIEQIMHPEASSSNSPVIRQAVKNIEVKDPYTVIVHCKRSTLFLENLLSNMESVDGMVLPKDYFEKVGKDEFAKHPIGSGPYKWHSQAVGSFIKLEATDKHWRDGVPKYKYMTFLIIPEESTTMAMLKTGEADISRISREAVKDALSAGLNVLSKEKSATLNAHINMQWTSPVFSDIRFRKALNLAVDKESIIKNLFAGMAEPMAIWPGSAVSLIGGDPTLKPHPYDPQEARRLIKEGGWEGHEFTLVRYPRAGTPELPRVVEAVAGYWEKIGLKPKIVNTEWAVYRKALSARKSQNTINVQDSPVTPEPGLILSSMEERYYFKNPRSRVNIPELNERFERMDKSLDVAEISKVMVEIYRYAYDHYVEVPICELNDMIATTKRIPKWTLGLRRNEMNLNSLIIQR